jgi:hypothetical protein
MTALKEPTTPVSGSGTATIGYFLLKFLQGIFGFGVCIAGFWGYDTYLKRYLGGTHDGEATPNITIPSEHYGIIGVFLLIVGIFIAIGYAFGEVGADRADKKGYERHFGFLLCFYFTAFGLWVMNRLSPNTVELARRTEAAREKDTTENPPTLTWSLFYPKLRPNFRAVLVLLIVAAGLTYMLQLRGEDLGGRAATIKSIPMVKSEWLCREEQTFTADKNTLIRTLMVQNGHIMADAAGLPMYEEKEISGIQSEQMKSIGADDYLLREYLNMKTGIGVELYLVYRRYGRREFNHNPDMCFPAGGYIQETKDVAELPYGGQMVPAVHITFDGSRVERGPGQMGVPETTVSYFFASGKKTEHSFLKQQMWMAMERLLPNKNGWALLRLTTPHMRNSKQGATPISPSEAFAAQQDFMQTFGGEVEKSITTDDTPDAPLVNADGTPVTQ